MKCFYLEIIITAMLGIIYLKYTFNADFTNPRID